MHKRKIIRNLFVEFLLGKTDAGDRVYNSITFPTQESKLPAIIVYSEDETGEIFNTAPRDYLRKVRIITEIKAQANETELADTLDDIAEQIETIIFKKDDYDELQLEDIVLSESNMIFDLGKRPMGACKIVWTVSYITQIGISDIISDFKGADLEYSNFPDPNNESGNTEDIVDLT